MTLHLTPLGMFGALDAFEMFLAQADPQTAPAGLPLDGDELSLGKDAEMRRELRRRPRRARRIDLPRERGDPLEVAGLGVADIDWRFVAAQCSSTSTRDAIS